MHSLSTGAFDRLRQFLLSDSFVFAEIVCGHNDLVPELHMPLSYLACGLTDKLITTLDAKGFDSYVTRKLRAELWRRQIDWHTPSGRAALEKLMDFVNVRWFRGSFKSSCITHAATTFLATVNPNITAKITHATDEKAWEFCSQIGATIRSGVYNDLFPERVPAQPHKDITEGRITLGGRTVSRPQTTIQASGYLTKDTGGHYDLFVIDDLVMERNATPELLKGVHTWLRGIEGYYIEAPGVRVRRIHVGTKWDEDDDDAFLTRGSNARNCLTVRVPIEEHADGEVVNIMAAGKPTIPQLYDAAKIAAKKERVVNGTEKEAGDVDGARSWRCNYLLDAYAGNVRMFSPAILDDPLRSWMGPYPHPLASKSKEYEKRFMVSRFERDEQGRVIGKDKQPVDTARDNWRIDAKVLTYDPWKDLDRVITLDPAWTDGGNNWAVTAAGIDSFGVNFQLETRSDTDGMEGWIDALDAMEAYYRPRVIGFGAGAYQDAIVKNLMKTDKRLRRMRSRIVPIPEKGNSKETRIRAGFAEPLKMYRWLLIPATLQEDFGGQATRDEAKNYKGGKNAVDGILDTMWMVDAVARRVRTSEDREQDDLESARRDRMRRHSINEALGVPLCA